uniref:Metalloendopeptidase n=1 Tax=Meloidogyne enterolobii TaxID=390850 RepID=A0A6V7VLU8_MELEN|nr:unnamed protein product [Meloidogyne enterolobii]
MFPFLNYLINSPLLSPNRLLFLFIIQRVLAQQQQFSLYSRHDIVDKTVKAAETFLSAQDLENMPEREVDLRELGIRVETDPTLGTRNRGDIAELPPSLRPQFDANGLARNSIRQPYRRWPRNEIPYALSSQYGAYSRSVIAKAMDEVGTVVHELMHAVGFFHEQSRHDRDQYIQILWSNVLRGADDQFEKYGFNTIDQLGEPYDYGSIMHYGAYAFSANGKRTIVPRRAGSHKMGQRIAFSEIDLRKINKLYQCDMLNTRRNSLNTVSSNRPLAQKPSTNVRGFWVPKWRRGGR